MYKRQTFYHTFKDDSELDVKGYYFYSRRGLPGAVTLYNPLSDDTLWDENTFVQARYRKHFSPRWSLQAVSYTHLDVYKRQKHRFYNRTGASEQTAQLAPKVFQLQQP